MKKSEMKLALKVELTNNKSSISARLRFVHIDTSTPCDDTYLGKIEYPWSTYDDYAWMTFIEGSGYAYNSTTGDNPGWREFSWDIFAKGEKLQAGILETLAKKLRWIETRTGKHAEKFGAPQNIAEWVFHLAIATKADYLIFPKRESSSGSTYDFRALAVDGHALNVLRELFALPKVEQVEQV